MRDTVRSILALTRLARFSALSSLCAIALVFAVGALFRAQKTDMFQRELRIKVDSQLSLITTQIESDIRLRMTALNGLADSISTDTGNAEPVFDRLAPLIRARHADLLRISVAPQNQATAVSAHNPDEIDSIRQLRLDRFPAMRRAIERARKHAKPSIFGPVRLPSGHTAFEIFVPIYDEAGMPGRLWGVIESAMDADHLLRMARRYDSSDGQQQEAGAQAISVAIRDVSLNNRAQDPFFGHYAIFSDNPVTRVLDLHGGRWEMAATPQGGWAVPPPEAAMIDRLIAVSMAASGAIAFLVSMLVKDRRETRTRLERREREVLSLSQRLDFALSASGIGVWDLDPDTEIQTWDDRMYTLHGRSAQEGAISLQKFRKTLHADDVSPCLIALRQALLQEKDYRMEYRVVLPFGRLRHIRSFGAPHQDAAGRMKLIGISVDITDDVIKAEALRKAHAVAEARNHALAEANSLIEHNAYHDPLTALGNRRKLDRQLAEIAHAAGGLAGTALLHLDLDRFKQINDTHGHAAGDAMLIHTAQVLRQCVTSRDLVARIGGDEFVIVISPAPDRQALTALADEIVERMRQPHQHNGVTCRSGVSIGIALGGPMAQDAAALMINADVALYRAKQNGRNRVEVYTEALQSAVTVGKRMADEIMEGLERNEFVAWYQPQVDARSHRMVGAEVLIRWNHPRQGLLAPAAFLPVAEEIGVVPLIDAVALRRALTDQLHWATHNVTLPRLSVNVSARRLADPDLLDSLKAIDIPAGRMTFELVESIFLDESSQTVSANLEGLKALGIAIEIDDFGTGHTSILGLLRTKPNGLKIDRRLVMPILTEPSARRVLRSIVEIGRALDLTVTAEGVETLELAAMLAEIGCTTLQGYVFSRPLPPDAFLQYMLDEKARRQLIVA
ncbi:EAL domain-containing protein [Rhizobium rhizosphaerae]|uniref:EAL domain-containing protein n=1 Tax=Xaviernesmea rhizosphaerae TaxID=1672749 RepID=UPI0009C15578|nr:EAL domain-containing protein [Xaviernesmea rhizosphaerae]